MNRFDSGIFLENIEWFDETGLEIVHRLPEQGSGEIKFGAQLTVRESQAAVLFYKGKACDCFGPGRHTLRTGNIPLLTKLLSAPWRMDSPLRAEVYMVNLKYFPNLKWGTQNPVAYRDSELGLIRLRAHGIFNIQVVQPVLFINTLVGTMGKISADDIAGYLKMVIVSRLNDYLGEKVDTIFNLPGQFDDISAGLQKNLESDFTHFGLRLSQLYITSITPPDEVQSAIDDQGRVAVLKDMDKFVQMKAAMAMEKAAQNQSEAGGGMGLGLGMLLPQMFAAHNMGNARQAPPQQGTSDKAECSDCHGLIPQDAKFCPVCGHQQLLLLQCAHCGKNIMPDANFCPRCGQPVQLKKAPKICTNCQADNLSDALYCNNCGNRLG